jgi:hypothetical protein
MDYVSGSNTVETTLSYQGMEIINAVDQDSRVVENISIERKPCADDTVNPIISDNLYTN